MPVIIIPQPPQKCSLANIYKILATKLNTESGRQYYQAALDEHKPKCKRCQEYEHQKARQA